MNEQKIDFDTDELHDVVLEIITNLEERFNGYEKTHGPNFTASLAGTLAKELLVRLASTSDDFDQAKRIWQDVYASALKSLADWALLSKHMSDVTPGLGARQ